METGIKDQSMESLLMHVGQDVLGFASQIAITVRTVKKFQQKQLLVTLVTLTWFLGFL